MRRRSKLNSYLFTYAVGRVRALENLLLKEIDFQQMLDLDFYQMKEFLSKNKKYGQRILTLNTLQEIDDFLKEKENDLETLMKSLIIEKEIFLEIKELLEFPKDAVKKIEFLKSRFLENYFRYYIDFFNIKILFSLKEKKEFVAGGFIPQGIFLGLINSPYDEILRTFKNTIYSNILEEGILYYQKENTFLYLEARIRSFLINFIKPQKYSPFGIEPLIAYYLANINELELLRVVLLGKLFRLDREIIMRGLGTTYV